MLEGRRGAALGLAFFVGLGAFGIWSEISSQPSQVPQHRATPKEAKRQSNQRGPGEVLLDFVFHDGITTFTLLLALFTGTLVWVAIIEIRYLRRAETRSGELAGIAQKQMLITERQTDIIEKQHVVTHRPRLRIRHVGIVDSSWRFKRVGLFFDHGQPIEGGLVVVNIGGTKAKIIESYYRVYFSNIGLPKEDPLDDYKRRKELIIKDEVFDVGQSMAIPLNDEISMEPTSPQGQTRLRRFEEEGWQIYIMGRIRYQDEGGNDRFMGFCRISDGKSRFRVVDDPDYEYED
jgi:hypothetical protein